MIKFNSLPEEIIYEIAERCDQRTKWRLMVALDRFLPVAHSKRYMIVTEDEILASPLTSSFVQRYCRNVLNKPLTVEYSIMDRKVCQLCFGLALECDCISICGETSNCYECKGYCLDIETVCDHKFNAVVEKPHIKNWIKFYEPCPKFSAFSPASPPMKYYNVRIIMKLYIELLMNEYRKVKLNKNWVQLICKYLYNTTDYSNNEQLFKKRLCLYKFL
ncbi:ORF-12 [Buzura suppressaria nucleopolyhedrovirus]|uniref:ORF-12 n=1 Tax=Buzura suppressaria nuclear polyhedrosis virus TaxID=74320 RepID=W5VKB2_NPVBS|nr:ORF-12 [Buzura suppressaria nucleopolyhedrovirus]AHH82601.1 ORF-12 [Buzura suppressaria nucleopolyhedrovirus]QYF10594.1 hypothetical protein [Buzura suppressaria nucleopolyhedrovirus]